MTDHDQLATLAARIEALERTVATLAAAHRAALLQPAKAKALDDRILMAVADEFAASPAAIMGMRRDAHIVIARHIAVYLTRRLARLSYPTIAAQFGYRDHTSVMHADRHVDRRRQVDTDFALRVARIEAALLDETERGAVAS